MATKLFRYTHKLTGEEMGIAYSASDGRPMELPDLHSEEIPEDKKAAYINKQREQDAKKNRDMAVGATDQSRLGQLILRVDALERAIKMLVRRTETIQKTGGKG